MNCEQQQITFVYIYTGSSKVLRCRNTITFSSSFELKDLKGS